MAGQADEGLCLPAWRGGKSVGGSKPGDELALEAEDFLPRGGGGGERGQGVLAHGEGPADWQSWKLFTIIVIVILINIMIIVS